MLLRDPIQLKKKDIKFICSEKATKFCEIPTNWFICPMYCQSNNWWRFLKILWPSQNIWTLTVVWFIFIQDTILVWCLNSFFYFFSRWNRLSSDHPSNIIQRLSPTWSRFAQSQILERWKLQHEGGFQLLDYNGA